MKIAEGDADLLPDVDPSGFAKCKYSQGSQTLVCVSNDGGKKVSFASGEIFSGQKGLTSDQVNGPIMTGKYAINQHPKDLWFSLAPNRKTRAKITKAGRTPDQFRLHPGSNSLGCLTRKSDK